jgi:hypothetical protein
MVHSQQFSDGTDQAVAVHEYQTLCWSGARPFETSCCSLDTLICHPLLGRHRFLEPEYKLDLIMARANPGNVNRVVVESPVP